MQEREQDGESNTTLEMRSTGQVVHEEVEMKWGLSTSGRRTILWGVKRIQ